VRVRCDERIAIHIDPERGGILPSGRTPTTQINHSVTVLRCSRYWWRYTMTSLSSSVSGQRRRRATKASE
jgi:hypothetical protein